MHREPQARELRVLTLIVFAAVLLLNLLLLTKNYYWDGVFFAQVIEDAPRLNPSLLHPNHLLYLPFEFLIYRAVRWAGAGARALTTQQISNCVFGAAAAAMFLRLSLEQFRSRYIALVLTAVFAFSATWWKFATDADAYTLAVLLLLVCFALVLPGRKPRPFAVALMHALAMMVHQLSVFFFPVALAGLILQSDKRGKWKNAVSYSAVVVALTLGVYCFSFYLVTGTFSAPRFISWTTSFSPEQGFAFNVWNNLSYTLRSQWRVFFGGRVSFVRDLWGPAMIALTVLALASILAFLFSLFSRLGELRRAIAAAVTGPRKFRALSTLCLIWIVTYLVFLFFFIPQNTFYRLFYLPPLILLGGTLLAGAESAPGHVRRYRAALFAGAMFAANLALSQYPYSQTRANPPLQLAQKLNQAWPAGTTIYFATPNSDAGLVRFFNPQTAWVQVTPEKFLEDVSKLPSDRTTWIETTLIDALERKADGKAWLDAHALRRTDCELVNRKFRIQFWELKPEGP